MPMALALLPAATAATISLGSAATLGFGTAFGTVEVAGCSGAGSPQPASAANKAEADSARTRLLLMELGRHQGTSAAHTNRRFASHRSARKPIAKEWVDHPWRSTARTGRRYGAPRSARR